MNKILLIDDDEELCEEISEILRDEGFEIHSENDGLKGFRSIDAKQHDLILLDLKIPGMNGFDVLKAAKSKYPKLKIIVLSGRPFNKEMMQGKNVAEDYELSALQMADAVISKPYEIKVLLSKIKTLIEQP
ncbi:MAG: hypothetical protein A3J83_08660 [Elusimicrobia bacterium RIFOXYA2_FULL_40_6]|nr:MAG: hypothetical protein A3J83_08660 [Elusimicrobia bacterium RIFOXYA2_FULL_40_6]